ncbi:MAG: hypothetical protein IKP95_11330 [Ruminococcus sp.]|nr:hypothetical protein [Ruminococcus sp.]
MPEAFTIKGSGTEDDPFSFTPVYEEFSCIMIHDLTGDTYCRMEEDSENVYVATFYYTDNKGKEVPFPAGQYDFRLMTALSNTEQGFDTDGNYFALGGILEGMEIDAVHHSTGLSDYSVTLSQPAATLTFTIDLTHYDPKTGEGATLEAQINAIEHYKCKEPTCTEEWRIE